MKTENRLPSLDGWRGISILLVIIGHEIIDGSHFGINNEDSLFRFFTWHIHGVRIFFVISGFIITHLLLKEEKLKDNISLKNFYLRRFFRIIPVLYVYLVILFILTLFFHNETITPIIWFLSLFFMANFWSIGVRWSTGHLWSLSVEEQFYFLWPVIFTNRRLRLIVPLFFILLAPILRMIEYKHPGLIGDASFFTNADAIFIGCLFAMYREKVFKKRYKIVEFIILSITAFILIAQKIALSGTGLISVPFANSLFAISIVILIERSFSPSSVLYKIFNLRILVWIGRISFSLYLWQQLFYHCSIFGDKIYTRFPLNILCMFVCAFLSYSFVEKPILRFRQNLMNKKIAREDATSQNTH
ncbi:MAG TPA: acyltransferase [Ferruginibacter sp.]|jgi:peptidoglycan/LPS O-acetylase OafA/YrhL|nr:acyltransferase [Ferruginibacter sp.]